MTDDGDRVERASSEANDAPVPSMSHAALPALLPGAGRRHLPTPLRAAKPTARRRRFVRRKIFIALVVLPAILLASLAFFGRSFLQSDNLTAIVAEELGREFAVPVAVTKVEFRFPNRVAAYHLSIGSPEGSLFPHLVTVPRISGRLRLWPLLIGRVEMESLRVEGAEVYIERDDQGVCTLTQAIDPASRAPNPETRNIRPGLDWTPPAVILRNVRVHSCPVSVFESEEPLVIPELVLRYLDDDHAQFTLTARADDPVVAGIHLDGLGNFVTGDLSTTFRVDRLQIDEEFRTRIPKSLRTIWDQYRPTGTADFLHRLVMRAGSIVENRATITLEGGGIEMSDPRISIEQVSGKIEVSPEGVRVIGPLVGHAFGGTAEIRGFIDLTPAGPGGGELGVELEDIHLDDSVRQALPPRLQVEWDRYSPKGVANLSLFADGDEFPPTIHRTHLYLREVEARFRDYPYPLTGLSGTVVVSDGSITVDASGGEAPAVSITARASTQAGRLLNIEVKLSDLTLGPLVRDSLPPDVRERYDEYDPSGLVDLVVLVGRHPGEDIFATVQITARDASIAHAAFPLRVDHVSGKVTISSESVSLADFRGVHGDSEVFLEKGEVVRGEDGHSEIEIIAPRLEIGPVIVAALPPESREVVRGFGLDRVPNGRVDTRVLLTSRGEDPLDVMVTARIVSPVLVHYEEFPYPLEFVQGAVIYDSSESLVHFVDLKTDGSQGPIIEVKGDQSNPDLDDPERSLLAISLKVDAGVSGHGIELGEPLLVQSLPPDLKEFSERMQLTGEVTGWVDVRYSSGGKTHDVVDYQGEVTLADGSVDFGLKLYDIDAGFIVEGGLDADHPHHFTGSIDNGSYRFSRFKIDVTRPTLFVYGVLHDEIGMQQNADRTDVPGYLPTPFFVEALMERDVSKVFQASIGPAQLFGGDLNGFFFVDLAENGDFAGEAECEGLNLALGGEDLFGTKEISGIAEGVVQLRGKTRDIDSMNGFGFANVYSARLKKIPALAALFLNPLAGLSDESLHFHKADVKRYVVRNQKIYIENLGDLRLESPVINIHGRGSLGFDGELDLLLEPQTLGGLPIISDLLNTLTRFRLKGKLDDPEVFGDQSD